jgi:glycerol-3-phosphate dehydrogenase
MIHFFIPSNMKNFQVAIIGGGVIGSAIGWELSKYNIDVVIFEKGIDVASGTSKANSGVIHSGINSASSSLKARFCVEGNQMFSELADLLGFNLKWVGKYVIARDDTEAKNLENLIEVGAKNGVPDLEIKNGSYVKKEEPNLSCHSALWVPTAGIVLPYEFTISLAENAAVNNVKFLLETNVIDLKKNNEQYLIKTNNGTFQSQIVINASGVDCKDIVSMIEEPDFKVYPCRGEYLVLDKKYSSLITSMIYPVPINEAGVLGIHITPTIEGNILIGPSAEFIDNRDDKSTTKSMMNLLLKEANDIIPGIPKTAVINAYSGIRCKLASSEEGGWADYRIEESKQNPGMINLLGIESPGLTAAPAIAKYVKNMILKHIDLETKKEFKVFKKAPRFNELSTKKQQELIKNDGRWGRIICRCELITEKEVIDALSNPLNSKSLSSVRYRCRAGMGRCQGGFCTQHIIRIMEKQYDININDIKLKSSGSFLFVGRTREVKND